jgi:hypothetical protein
MDTSGDSLAKRGLTAQIEVAELDIPDIIRQSKYPCPFCSLMLHLFEKLDGNTREEKEVLAVDDMKFFLFHVRRDHGLLP